jgi:hypothetical protein
MTQKTPLDSELLLKLAAVIAGIIVVAGLLAAAFSDSGRAKVAAAVASPISDPAATSSSPPLTVVDSFIRANGRPDVDDTTALDNPRPPIVTRWLIYKRQRVRVTYVQRGHIGDPPPYEWKFLAFQDPATDAVIDRNEVQRRMSQ